MSSGELIKKAEITRDTLRYYEKLKLLKPLINQNNGYKIYSDEDCKKLKFIKGAQKIGFKLSEIKDIYNQLSIKECQHQSMVPLLESRVKEIEMHMDELNSLREHLNFLIQDFKSKDCHVNPTDLNL